MITSRRTPDLERSHRDDDQRPARGPALASTSSMLPSPHAHGLALQRTAGNQAVTALTRSLHEEARGGSHPAPIASDGAGSSQRLPLTPVQRAVILLDVNASDYALQKVLIGLDPNNHELLRSPKDVAWFSQERARKNKLRAMIPYQNLEDVARAISERQSLTKSKAGQKGVPPEVPAIAADEHVYIVGHGRHDLVWTAPEHGAPITDLAPLAQWLKLATPEDWVGRTHLLTCNSARTVKPDTSTIRAWLAALMDTPVTGYEGFVYGMGRAGVKVLKPEFSALYNAGRFDATVGEHLTAMAYHQNAASSALGYKPRVKDVKNNGEWKKVWRLFTQAMQNLESQMKTVVEASGRDKHILENAKALSKDRNFQGLIRKQDELFSAFKLWREDR